MLDGYTACRLPHGDAVRFRPAKQTVRARRSHETIHEKSVYHLITEEKKPMITGKQKSFLKGLAHELDPIVMIGKSGLTDNVLSEIDACLKSRELVKIKLQEGAALEPKETANRVAAVLRAEFVQAIGRKFVLYRYSKERAKEGKQIILPR